MKTFFSLLILLMAFIAQGQTTRKSFYDTVAKHVCRCYEFSTDDIKPSSMLSLCLEKEYKSNSEFFKVFRLQIDNDSIKSLVAQEVIYRLFTTCASFHEDHEKEELGVPRSGKIFTGVFVSQRKLSNGQYEVIMKNDDGESIFGSLGPINESQFKGYLHYKLTIGYTVVIDKKTNRNLNLLQPNAPIRVIGDIEVVNE